MSILKNAVDSICLGIEDYNSSDPRRILSATRNLVSGILLLIKHKLAAISPPGSDEALIKEIVVPVMDANGTVSWKGQGKKTVDVHQMQTRCSGLGIAVDWRRVQSIVKQRNEVEHYFSSLNRNALRALIADSFLLIRDFMRGQLNQDPLSVLGEPTWNALVSITDVYEKEKEECEKNIASIQWTYSQVQDALCEWRCPQCGSGLIDVTNPGADKWSACFRCRACAKEYDFENDAAQAVESYFADANYTSVKHGGEPETIPCPNCHHETYNLEESACLICEETVEHECQRCGTRIPASEIDGSGYCSWCAHMMDKDD